jgi:phosphatidylserine/phosphatidylglycerophosphate/cardiolipin synthase-like enzyme
MHDKFIVADTGTVETGSFNFTKSAEEHNAENVIVLHDPATAGDYQTAMGEAMGRIRINEIAAMIVFIVAAFVNPAAAEDNSQRAPPPPPGFDLSAPPQAKTPSRWVELDYDERSVSSTFS